MPPKKPGTKLTLYPVIVDCRNLWSRAGGGQCPMDDGVVVVVVDGRVRPAVQALVFRLTCPGNPDMAYGGRHPLHVGRVGGPGGVTGADASVSGPKIAWEIRNNSLLIIGSVTWYT